MISKHFRFNKIAIFTTTVLTLMVILTTIVKANSVLETKTNPLSQACRIDCVTPYGKILGVASSNVVAYSNCQAQCVIFEPNHKNGTYTGIKWQCVEFARRWLLTHQGVVYGDVDIAADLWHKIDFVSRVADGKQFKLASHLNGSNQAPQVGDLLIYAKAFFQTGHVAVVTGVDLKVGIIQVAEQNFANQTWEGDYAREIPLIEQEGQYWLLDGYLLGWKRVLLGKGE
ncbi:D-alanyl-glycyl endopeptidase-like protein [Beggiatoa sp. PS]|nr:D-alanyl-glycyl endopeptidase-like protein [Beggiatoa sp. PS]